MRRPQLAGAPDVPTHSARYRKQAKAAVRDASKLMEIVYLGLKPPDLETPLIEFEVDTGGIVDLYNDFWLRGSTFDAEGLAFDFAAADGGNVRLQFRGVTRMHVEQSSDWVPQEADQIDHLLIRREGPWPRFEFKAGGLRYEFDAEAVALTR